MTSVRIYSASKLSATSAGKIEAFFKKKHSDKVEFSYETDPTLIGGFLAIDGEEYYDASVKGQLSLVKRNLS